MGNIKSKMAIGKLRLKKASPHIMVALGIGGAIYTLVSSCMKARKLDEVIEEEIEELDKLNNKMEEYEAGNEAMSEEDVKELKKEIRHVRFRAIRKGAKTFIVPILIGVISLGLIGGSHYILTSRLAGTSAALTAVDRAFKEYREGVVEKYGEEVDKELRFAKSRSKDKVTVIDTDTGEESEEEKILHHVGKKGISGYAIPFCRTYCGTSFQDNRYLDNLAMENARRHAELRLQSDGFVFLDQIYKDLGFSVTPASRRVGWFIDKETGEANGDGYIKFTIEETMFEFVDGVENGYIIDFNVDGEIDELLPPPRMKGVINGIRI